MSFPAEKQDPLAHINRYRRIIELHSIIYYALDDNVISDAKFDEFCAILVRLQKEYPKKAKRGYKPKLFKDFSGDTGMHLVGDRSRYSLAEWMIEHKGK